MTQHVNRMTQIVGAGPRRHLLPAWPVSRNGWEPALLLHEQVPADGDRGRPVLYVHGATFPSSLSVFFRFDGTSWADALNAAAFTVFGLDFAGYGGSERYPSMHSVAAGEGTPEGRSSVAVRQIARAMSFITETTGASRIRIVAHSWGTIVAGRFAASHPGSVDRLVLFGGVAERIGCRQPVVRPWELVTIDQQYARFVKDVPPACDQVLLEHEFGRWAETYLSSDPESRRRTPPAVAIPSGPAFDIAASWSGCFPYDPSGITAPVLLVRGEWDGSSTAEDAAWLRGRLSSASFVDDAVVPRGTHLMHLETGRTVLYAITNAFLAS